MVTFYGCILKQYRYRSDANMECAAWSAQTDLQPVSDIPNYIVVKNRPTSNEVMVAIFDQSRNTSTEYFNGAAYATSNWTLHTQHGNNAPANTKKICRFYLE